MRRELSESRRRDSETVRLNDELTVYVLFYEVFDERLKCRASGHEKTASGSPFLLTTCVAIDVRCKSHRKTQQP